MLTQEQGLAPVKLDLHVYDVVIIAQMIEKLLRSGLVTGKEINYVATVRQKLHASVLQTIGLDIDNPPASEDATELKNE